MPVLANARHELFAQEVAKGRPASEAYVVAGYATSGNSAEAAASRLLRNVKVTARIDELLAESADRSGVTVDRIVSELAKIGFSDIRKAVDWVGSLIEEHDNPDGGDTLVVKHIHSNHVRLISAKDIDDATAAAISEVRQSPTGGLSIKFHDKRAALVDLGRHVGMFKDRIEHTGKDGGPIEVADVSAREIIERRISSLAARGGEKGNPGRSD